MNQYEFTVYLENFDLGEDASGDMNNVDLQNDIDDIFIETHIYGVWQPNDFVHNK